MRKFFAIADRHQTIIFLVLLAKIANLLVRFCLKTSFFFHRPSPSSNLYRNSCCLPIPRIHFLCVFNVLKFVYLKIEFHYLKKRLIDRAMVFKIMPFQGERLSFSPIFIIIFTLLSTLARFLPQGCEKLDTLFSFNSILLIIFPTKDPSFLFAK